MHGVAAGVAGRKHVVLSAVQRERGVLAIPARLTHSGVATQLVLGDQTHAVAVALAHADAVPLRRNDGDLAPALDAEGTWHESVALVEGGVSSGAGRALIVRRLFGVVDQVVHVAILAHVRACFLLRVLIHGAVVRLVLHEGGGGRSVAQPLAHGFLVRRHIQREVIVCADNTASVIAAHAHTGVHSRVQERAAFVAPVGGSAREAEHTGRHRRSWCG